MWRADPAGRLRGGDGLLQAVHVAAHMDVRRGATGRGDAKHALDLGDGGTGRVGATEAHSDRALREAFAEDLLHCR